MLKNDDLKAIICDDPGFNDSEGVLKEITNAYAIDKLFQNRSSPTKILLFINYHDIYGRRKQIEETIGQLERMFPNIDELKQCIGLVISMSENDRSTNDYLEFLQARSSPSLQSWCNFFIENNHRVFRFPTPERSENGNQFHDFPDRSNIIQFITDENFDIIHIDHQIGLSDSAKKTLGTFGYQIGVKIANEVQLFNDTIKNCIDNCQEIDQLNAYMNIASSIIEDPFNNVDDLSLIIQNNLPDDQFNFNFTNLKELDQMNDFIGKQLKDNEFLSSTKKVIKCIMSNVIDDLKIRLDNILQHQKIEELKEEIDKLQRRRDEINDIRDQLHNQQNELDERMNQVQRRENEVNDHQNRLQEQQNELNERINELRRRENELNDQQNQVNNMRNNLDRLGQRADQNSTSPYWSYVIGTAGVVFGVAAAVTFGRRR